MNPEELAGLAAVVVVTPVLVSHLRRAAAAVIAWVWEMHGDYRPRNANASAWPLVSDIVAVALTFVVWRGGTGPDWLDNGLIALIVGLSLSVAAGQVRDRLLDARQRLGADR